MITPPLHWQSSHKSLPGSGAKPVLTRIQPMSQQRNYTNVKVAESGSPPLVYTSLSWTWVQAKPAKLNFFKTPASDHTNFPPSYRWDCRLLMYWYLSLCGEVIGTTWWQWSIIELCMWLRVGQAGESLLNIRQLEMMALAVTAVMEWTNYPGYLSPPTSHSYQTFFIAVPWCTSDINEAILCLTFLWKVPSALRNDYLSLKFFRITAQKAQLYLKGTQAWEFFGLQYWNLYFFVVSYADMLRFRLWTIIGGDRIVLRILRLRRMKKKF